MALVRKYIPVPIPTKLTVSAPNLVERYKDARFAIIMKGPQTKVSERVRYKITLLKFLNILLKDTMLGYIFQYVRQYGKLKEQ